MAKKTWNELSCMNLCLSVCRHQAQDGTADDAIGAEKVETIASDWICDGPQSKRSGVSKQYYWSPVYGKIHDRALHG